MIATIGFLLALEYTKYVFGRGSVPDHAGGAYTHNFIHQSPALPRLASWLKGALLLRGGEGRRRKGVGEGREGEGREERGWKGRGEGRKVKTPPPPIPAYAPDAFTPTVIDKTHETAGEQSNSH